MGIKGGHPELQGGHRACISQERPEVTGNRLNILLVDVRMCRTSLRVMIIAICAAEKAKVSASEAFQITLSVVEEDVGS